MADRDIEQTVDNSQPTAWDLGYADGRLNQPTWRKVLKAEYLDEYDAGFHAGRTSAIQEARGG